LEEYDVVWLDGANGTEIMLTAPSDIVPKDLPSWLPAQLWAALYATEDGARVYAILDPQLWPFLKESLTDGPVETLCPSAVLFHTENLDDDVAESSPWVVDITLPGSAIPDSPPNRLFADIALHYQEHPAGVFLRSPVDLDEMHRSLRKLTKFQDNDGKWYYNRFWEPEFFLYFISFLAGRRLLAPLNHVTSITAAAEGALLMAPCNLTSCAHAAQDRETDLELLFEAGEAMVALRRARMLEAEYERGLDPADVYALAKSHLHLEGLDYASVCKCIDICFVLQAFFGERAQEALHDQLVGRIFDANGDITLDLPLLHGHVMFALSQNIAPHLLRNTFWRS